MPHIIKYNSEIHIVEIKIQGDLVLKEAREIFSELAQFIKEENCFLILTDLRESTMKLSTVDIYDLPKILSDILASSEIDANILKRAFVVAKNSENYSFHENVTNNRGQINKMFEDIDEAKKWLLE